MVGHLILIGWDNKMNKRIEELSQQAYIKTLSQIKDDPLPVKIRSDYFLNLEQKNFAELIVKDCVGIYDKIDNGNLHMGTDDYLEALRKTFFGVNKL